MKIDPLSKKLLSGAGKNSFISLMYHSISQGASKPDWIWSVSFRDFCNQMTLLKDYGWTTMCSNQLPEKIENLPEKTVLITFDDGFANNFFAFKELVRLNMNANWFIVTKDIGKISSWTDNDAPANKLLDSVQLLEMQDAGMEIGSHTVSHCRLTQQSSEQVKFELSKSKSDLSDLLGQPVNSFAYPYGLYTSEIIDIARLLGYKNAFTTRSGFGLVDSDHLKIRRISIMADDSLSTFARKLAFADNNVSWSKIGNYSIKRIKSRLYLT